MELSIYVLLWTLFNPLLLLMNGSYLKWHLEKRLAWYRPRTQVQPRMTDWASILNTINLQRRSREAQQSGSGTGRPLWTTAPSLAGIVPVYVMPDRRTDRENRVWLNLVSLDCDTSLFMLARVGLRHTRVAQNSTKFILNDTKAHIRWAHILAYSIISRKSWNGLRQALDLSCWHSAPPNTYFRTLANIYSTCWPNLHLTTTMANKLKHALLLLYRIPSLGDKGCWISKKNKTFV